MILIQETRFWACFYYPEIAKDTLYCNENHAQSRILEKFVDSTHI